jgi:hypothetical protein
MDGDVDAKRGCSLFWCKVEEDKQRTATTTASAGQTLEQYR